MSMPMVEVKTRSRATDEVHEKQLSQDTVIEMMTEYIKESGEALEITMSQASRGSGIDKVILRSNK